MLSVLPLTLNNNVSGDLQDVRAFLSLRKRCLEAERVDAGQTHHKSRNEIRKYLEKQVLVFYRLRQSRHSFQILVFPSLKPARTAGFPFLSGLNRIGLLL